MANFLKGEPGRANFKNLKWTKNTMSDMLLWKHFLNCASINVLKN